LNKLSIIICTYKRKEILTECLKILTSQNLQFVDEIIIVNNNGLKDDLKSLEEMSSKIKVVVKKQIGLSHARNKGLQKSNSDWLFFLDDDAKIRKDTIPQIIDTIEKHDFTMFSGIWKAWHRSIPPKWLPIDTGNYILKGEATTREIGTDYVSGGVMVIKKSVLEEIGGFPTELGMAGDKVAYGEESYVEQKVKDLGHSVGINPNIIIDHLVGKHKYQLSWHLKAAYAKGRDGQKIKPLNLYNRVGNLVIGTLTGWIKPMVKLFFHKGFFWQNFVISYIGNILYAYGSLVSPKSDL